MESKYDRHLCQNVCLISHLLFKFESVYVNFHILLSEVMVDFSNVY